VYKSLNVEFWQKFAATCIKITAIVSPEGARYAKCVGRRVAKTTTRAVITGRLPP
jgi:hypothetical protein